MAAVTSPETSPQPRVYFQTPAGTTEEPETPVRKQGRVTVKYDRKELRKRLNLEEWIIDQLTDLYDCEEEAIPELEIDVDELLDMPSDVERAARVKDLLVDCFKPTEDFVSELLDKIRGMQKLSTPQKKWWHPSSLHPTYSPPPQPSPLVFLPQLTLFFFNLFCLFSSIKVHEMLQLVSASS